jgi:pyruvate,water dikinase
MSFWHREKPAPAAPAEVAHRVRTKYASFRELLAANNESLELMARLQEDLQHVPPHRDVIEAPIAGIFERVRSVVGALDKLTGTPHRTLLDALGAQQQEIERFAATLQETAHPRLAAWLSEVNAESEAEVGSKAAELGEIRNKVGLPVPDGFVLTTEAYVRYCGLPLWREIRDATRGLDLNDLGGLREVSRQLRDKAMNCAVPRAIEVAIAARAETLLKNGGTLAVRSSGKGEGGDRTCAGQFLSVLNVPRAEALDAYKQVVASRFSDRALFYRLSTGLLEVESPMAVLFLPMLPARASGIMYTRDPADPKSKTLWITATRGLGPEIASGRSAADMFVVSRSRPHSILSRSIVPKDEQLVLQDGGGLARVALLPGARDEPSVDDGHLHTLAEWGACLEEHYRTPQDIEWVLDQSNRLWIVQSRSLANIDVARAKSRPRPKAEPKIQGGRTVYPGQASGSAFLVEEIQRIGEAPAGAIVFVRKPSPEIVEIFPRIAGLVAEWGNVTGHAASLLREFQVPSVFQMPGAFDHVTDGEPVSLDAVQTRVYPGILWPSGRREAPALERHRARKNDPIATRLLTLNLLDPSASNFRPAGCKTTHDVLRYCHEKAIEAMFAVNDYEFEHGAPGGRQLTTTLPLNVLVVDLGGGLAASLADRRGVAPAEIVSRPFQALWSGLAHPGVSWTRHMPATIGDLASVLGNSLGPQEGDMRPLGEKSYLLVADEYLNLNTRLAYHYSLIDTCLSDDPGNNYISFRFEGGGASHPRRSLRACFLESCLLRYGFQVDRRIDLVNAWYRKAPAEQIAERLDMLGRLLACSSQLDMYMTSREVMNWFVQQFLEGNYLFQTTGQPKESR